MPGPAHPLRAPDRRRLLPGPGGLGQHLEAALAGQMEYTYFPITLDQLAAGVRYHDLVEGTFDVGGVRVTARYLNHPALALGYRLEAGGATVVYAVDHEPHSRHQPEPAGRAGPAARPVHAEDQRHVEFLAGADLVIHDAMYTMDEYPSKINWGHSAAEHAVDFAVAAGARRLALFHHEPVRDDAALDRLVEACRQRAAAAGSALEVFAAAEGQVIELPEQARESAPEALAPSALAADPIETPSSAETVLIVDDEPDIVRLLEVALRSEGFRLLSAFDGESALALARAERPDLILLDWRLPRQSGLDVCRALRAEADPRLRDVPVVLLTALDGAEDTAQGFAAGATDYLTKPFKPTLVRTRVRGWLLRARTQQAAP